MADLCIQFRIHFFLQDSFKGINCSTALQNPNDLSSQTDKEKKNLTTSDWLSSYPVCHLLGHTPRVKTAYGTDIFADMKVVKDFISTSKNFYLWQ